MSAVVIAKGRDGKLHGLGEKGERAWRKFRERVDQMQPGDTIHFEWRVPRSLPHHRLFFAKLGALMDRQERFEEVDKLRGWLTVGAGYCDYVPGAGSEMVAIPQSIAFDKLDEVDFGDLHHRVDSFLRTDHARAFLWPQMSADLTWSMVDEFLRGFD